MNKKTKNTTGMSKTSILMTFLILSPLLLSYSFICFPNLPLKELDSSLECASEETHAGQQVIDYYRSLFMNDWELGFKYNETVDGLGFAQSYDIYGSGYKDYSIAPQTFEGNYNITPILSPDTSMALTLALINSANVSLDIEQMYFQEGLDDIVNAIIARKNAGVIVKIIVDDSGSAQAPLDSLKTAGISIRISKPDADAGNYFDTQHNKGIIVDGKRVLIASINWSPNSLTNNREAGLIVDSIEVAEYYQDLFDYDWSASVEYDNTIHFLNANEHLTPESAMSLSIPYASYEYTNTFTSETFTGEMNVSCLASPDNCFEVVEALLLDAEESIDISVYTLSSPYLMEALIDRIEAGVNVNLILEKENVGSYERNYNRWTMANLTTIEHNGRLASGRWASSSGEDANFAYQHCKYAIIDNDTLIISSGNWGRSSCPKPKDDSGDGYRNVDGNRDWWFVVYGENPGEINNPSGNGGNTTDPIQEFLESLIYIIIAAVIAIGLFLAKRYL